MSPELRGVRGLPGGPLPHTPAAVPGPSPFTRQTDQLWLCLVRPVRADARAETAAKQDATPDGDRLPPNSGRRPAGSDVNSGGPISYRIRGTPSASKRRNATLRPTQPMRAERAGLPWGPGPGPPGQLAIGGSKSGAGAKGEASFAPRPNRFRPLPASPGRPGRPAEEPRTRAGRTRPVSRRPRGFSKTRTRLGF